MNIGKTIIGAHQMVTPDVLKNALPDVVKRNVPDYTPYSKAVIDFYKNRYGGEQNIKDTLYNDPVGSAADLAALLSGIGGAAEGAAKTGTTLARIGAGVSRAGELVDPLRAVGRVGGMLIQAPAEAAARKIVNSNLKPTATLKLRNPDIPPADAFLKQGVNMTKGGADVLEKRVASQGDQLSNLVQNTPGKFELQPLLDKLDALEEAYRHQPNAEADLAAVRSAREQLLSNPLYSKPKMGPGQMVGQDVQVPHPFAVDAAGNPIMQTTKQMVQGPDVEVGRELVPQSAAEIDRMKKNVYAGLKDKYGREGAGTIESDKALGRGLKSILDENVPGAKNINAAQRQTIVAKKALDAAIMRRENNHAFGLMDMLQLGVTEGGVGAIPFGHPGAGAAGIGAGALMYASRHPLPASYLARGLHKVGTATMPTTIRAAEPASRINEATKNVDTYPLNASDAVNWFKGYLGRQNDQN